jgi:endonuclease I
VLRPGAGSINCTRQNHDPEEKQNEILAKICGLQVKSIKNVPTHEIRGNVSLMIPIHERSSRHDEDDE